MNRSLNRIIALLLIPSLLVGPASPSSVPQRHSSKAYTPGTRILDESVFRCEALASAARSFTLGAIIVLPTLAALFAQGIHPGIVGGEPQESLFQVLSVAVLKVLGAGAGGIVSFVVGNYIYRHEPRRLLERLTAEYAGDGSMQKLRDRFGDPLLIDIVRAVGRTHSERILRSLLLVMDFYIKDDLCTYEGIAVYARLRYYLPGKKDPVPVKWWKGLLLYRDVLAILRAPLKTLLEINPSRLDEHSYPRLINEYELKQLEEFHDAWRQADAQYELANTAPRRAALGALNAYAAKFYSVMPREHEHGFYSGYPRWHISDPDYLPRAAAELSPQAIPENHFLRTLTSIYVPEESAVDEDKVLKLLADSGQVDMVNLRRDSQKAVGADEKRKVILNAAIPLLLGSDKMLESARVALRMIMASYRYQTGWESLPDDGNWTAYANTPANEFIAKLRIEDDTIPSPMTPTMTEPKTTAGPADKLTRIAA